MMTKNVNIKEYARKHISPFAERSINIEIIKSLEHGLVEESRKIGSIFIYGGISYTNFLALRINKYYKVFNDICDKNGEQIGILTVQLKVVITNEILLIDDYLDYLTYYFRLKNKYNYDKWSISYEYEYYERINRYKIFLMKMKRKPSKYLLKRIKQPLNIS